MSEKAQEVRRKYLKSMEFFREKAEIAFDYVLDEIDERILKEDYSSVELWITSFGIPYISNSIDDNKGACREAEIGLYNHWLFFKILEGMFNKEEGYSAKINTSGVLYLSVNLDVV